VPVFNPSFRFDPSFLFAKAAPSAETDAQVLRRLDGLAWFLDAALRLPVLGTRVGADALLNVVPGAGLALAKGLSAYIIWEAHRLGVPRPVLAKMLANLGIDFAISVVPLAGWVGDVFFRANLRNMALLRAHLEERRGSYGPQARQPEPAAPPTIEGEWRRVS
jgi:hypothetical protein